MIRRVLLAAALLALGGCTSSSPPPPAPEPACPTPASAPLGELRGTGSLWALFFPTAEGPGVVAGREAKIVWKISGTGTFTIAATGPEGATVDPSWGPTLHGSSTWRRPGEEWGTGWIFPTAGCWTVRAETSDGAAGELRLAVTA